MKKINILTKCILLWFTSQSVLAYRPYDSCPALEEEPWSYDGRTNGPWRWADRYPLCNGNKQSPINIDDADVDVNENLEKLTLVNYDVPVKRAEFLNNGHTVEVTPQDGVDRYTKIGGMIYRLRQFHFHWQKSRNDGTEHSFNGHRFNLEAHFVHTSDRNETAVVGVLYKFKSGKNKALQPIVDILPRVRYQDDRVVIKTNLRLDGLLPGKSSSFYRYTGSLTTPPCTEGVTWNVLKKVSSVGYAQLQQFYRLYAVRKENVPPNSGACRLTNNVRPLQRVNGRQIVASS